MPLICFPEFYENKGTLKRGQKANFISLEKNNTRPSTLRFPGKICWDQERKRLAISDTGQHRVLVTDGRGVITVRNFGKRITSSRSV